MPIYGSPGWPCLLIAIHTRMARPLRAICWTTLRGSSFAGRTNKQEPDAHNQAFDQSFKGRAGGILPHGRRVPEGERNTVRLLTPTGEILIAQ